MWQQWRFSKIYSFQLRCPQCVVSVLLVMAHTVNYVGRTAASLVQLVASVWCTSVTTICVDTH